MLMLFSKSRPLFPLLRSLSGSADSPLPSATAEGNSLLRRLRLVANNKLHAARSIPHRIVPSSPLPDAVSAVDCALSRRRLISLLHSGQLSKVQSFLERASSSADPRLDPDLVEAMIHCYCRLGHLDAAELHFNRLISAGYSPSVPTCAFILHAFCSRLHHLAAFELFQLAARGGFLPTRSAFNLLIYGLSSDGRPSPEGTVLARTHDQHRRIEARSSLLQISGLRVL